MPHRLGPERDDPIPTCYCSPIPSRHAPALSAMLLLLVASLRILSGLGASLGMQHIGSRSRTGEGHAGRRSCSGWKARAVPAVQPLHVSWLPTPRWHSLVWSACAPASQSCCSCAFLTKVKCVVQGLSTYPTRKIKGAPLRRDVDEKGVKACPAALGSNRSRGGNCVGVNEGGPAGGKQWAEWVETEKGELMRLERASERVATGGTGELENSSARRRPRPVGARRSASIIHKKCCGGWLCPSVSGAGGEQKI